MHHHGPACLYSDNFPLIYQQFPHCGDGVPLLDQNKGLQLQKVMDL
jgi:hypothetical protein